jgi:chromosome segregation ATPase
MARAGIYKSEVQKARDTLLAQGRHPSIDAVRAELGHTGSKTTIHRYLKELEDEDGATPRHSVAVSDALQELVGRLAARLHEEADARIDEIRLDAAHQVGLRETALAELQQAFDRLQQQLAQTQQALQEEQATHAQTRQSYQHAKVLHAQLEQQVIGLKDRLAENEAHRQSLEDKHLHARAALEHYREAAKEQREQEQRRHEQQVQQLQAELRTVNQTLIVKQNELTRAYQDAARSGAELVATRKELQRSEQALEKTVRQRDELQARVTQLEAGAAAQHERLQQLASSRDELWQLLQQRALPTEAAPAISSQETLPPRAD